MSTGRQQKETVAQVSIRPLPERGRFSPLKLSEQVRGEIVGEVDRWKKAAPELFEGEAYERWRRWTVDVVAEGLAELGGNKEEAPHVFLDLFRDWALILTQEGYPFHERPESWALANALTVELSINLTESEFVVEDRLFNVTRSNLIGWLIDNPKRFET